MDNYSQIAAIRRYREHLSRQVGRDIDANVAARLWVRKYARLWRIVHEVRAGTGA
ncbi:MAG: hypothetical protein GF418_17550 [Chitinivibrionales bacterium]|nr:hypothetical protein [Chitinivibrionales bacterium]MBD3397427.1 hypothetical protein [Chitinivibrionales bacterium]